MNQTLFVMPAYGRKYETTEAMMADWNGGKDFRIAMSGPYFSIRDTEALKKDGYRYIKLAVGGKIAAIDLCPKI